jgi:hypothetical protein
MMKKLLIIFLYVFVALSALGVIFTVAVHLAAMFDLSVPEESFWLLPGMFIVWFPTVIAASLITRGSNRKDFWKVALRGAPRWMQYMIYGSFAYAIFNFIFFIVIVRGDPQSTDASMLRVGSGHVLPFYSVALGVLYSATQIQKKGFIRKCPNGHEVSLSAQYCEECGQLILDEVK